MGKRLRFRYKTRPRTGTSMKMRSCIVCGKNFRSEGPHNRRCPRCNSRIEHAKDGSYYLPTVYSVEPGKITDVFD